MRVTLPNYCFPLCTLGAYFFTISPVVTVENGINLAEKIPSVMRLCPPGGVIHCNENQRKNVSLGCAPSVHFNPLDLVTRIMISTNREFPKEKNLLFTPVIYYCTPLGCNLYSFDSRVELMVQIVIKY